MITFKEACSRFPHRFTMEHVPAWATKPAPNGKFYAPQHATDRAWYETTAFPHGQDHCESTPTWPVGVWLAAPYSAPASIGPDIIAAITREIALEVGGPHGASTYSADDVIRMVTGVLDRVEV